MTAIAADAAADTQTFFISRAGADADLASLIGAILEGAGHRVILQQWDFANANFMERMHTALCRSIIAETLFCHGRVGARP